MALARLTLARLILAGPGLTRLVLTGAAPTRLFLTRLALSWLLSGPPLRGAGSFGEGLETANQVPRTLQGPFPRVLPRGLDGPCRLSEALGGFLEILADSLFEGPDVLGRSPLEQGFRECQFVPDPIGPEPFGGLGQLPRRRGLFPGGLAGQAFGVGFEAVDVARQGILPGA